MAECEDRDHRRAERSLRAAGFTRPKWLSDFDFDANPAVSSALVNTLATCAHLSSRVISRVSFRGRRLRTAVSSADSPGPRTAPTPERTRIRIVVPIWR